MEGYLSTKRPSLHASPYTSLLRQYITAKNEERILNGKSQIPIAEQNLLAKAWMRTMLRQSGITVKDENATNVYDFVDFHDLDRTKPGQLDALTEVQAGRLLSQNDFYEIFAVMCHMNDKAADPDKVCMPRQFRIDAIFQEITHSPTLPPEGYAGNNKAAWTYEVKHNYTIAQDVNGVNRVFQSENGKPKVEQIVLEDMYQIIAENHLIRENGIVRHLSRDETQHSVRKTKPPPPSKSTSTRVFKEPTMHLRGTPGNISVTTQIIKDFVASCPGCEAKPAVKARKKGTEKTRVEGTNQGPKLANESRKRQAEFDEPEMAYRSPSKKRAMNQPSPNSSDTSQSPISPEQLVAHKLPYNHSPQYVSTNTDMLQSFSRPKHTVEYDQPDLDFSDITQLLNFEETMEPYEEIGECNQLDLDFSNITQLLNFEAIMEPHKQKDHDNGHDVLPVLGQYPSEQLPIAQSLTDFETFHYPELQNFDHDLGESSNFDPQLWQPDIPDDCNITLQDLNLTDLINQSDLLQSDPLNKSMHANRHQVLN